VFEVSDKEQVVFLILCLV